MWRVNSFNSILEFLEGYPFYNYHRSFSSAHPHRGETKNQENDGFDADIIVSGVVPRILKSPDLRVLGKSIKEKESPGAAAKAGERTFYQNYGGRPVVQVDVLAPAGSQTLKTDEKTG